MYSGLTWYCNYNIVIVRCHLILHSWTGLSVRVRMMFRLEFQYWKIQYNSHLPQYFIFITFSSFNIQCQYNICICISIWMYLTLYSSVLTSVRTMLTDIPCIVDQLTLLLSPEKTQHSSRNSVQFSQLTFNSNYRFLPILPINNVAN